MKKFLFPFFLLGSLAMVFVMTYTGADLKTPSTQHGILDLEFAYNTTKTNAILKAWTQQPGDPVDRISVARINTWWDFLFLFFYAGFLFLACKKIAANMQGPVAKAGDLIAKGAILAAFLDIFEDAGMLLTLNDQGSSSIALGTTNISVIKWALALMAVLYLLTGLLVLGYRKIKY